MELEFMGKLCKKCGYESTTVENKQELECPKCGAIYSKVEAHFKKIEQDNIKKIAEDNIKKIAEDKILKKKAAEEEEKRNKKAESEKNKAERKKFLADMVKKIKSNKTEQSTQNIKAAYQDVTVRDIDMPFWSMVNFMVKWAIASIPALFIIILLVYSAIQLLIKS